MAIVKCLMTKGAALLALLAGAQALAQTVPASQGDGAVAVVIFRSNDGVGGQVNISRNGKLHATLENGEFTRLPVCQGDITFEIAVGTGSAAGHTKYVHTGPQFDTSKQALRLTVGADGVSRVVAQDLAGVDLGVLRPHTRVASRVVNQCVVVAPAASAPAAVPAAPEVRTLELASDMLFPFASFDLDPVKADALIQERLRQVLPAGDVQRIAYVRVVGHSDPVGQPHRKQLVSLNRARAVAAYVQSQFGLPADRLQVVTRSDEQLRVADCPEKPVSVRNACNAPNRRVEVLIGVQR